ncbi:MAG: glycoside hydrolase family 1 protein [Candidatus Izemoplasmatales bacterium]
MAAQYVDGFLNRWFLDPIFKGSYPQDMVTLYASQGYLIPGSPADFELLRNNPGDFLGINMYSRGIQRYEPSNTFLYSADVRNSEATYSDMGWEVCPESLYDLLMDLKQHYGMPIWITENGGAFPDKLEKNGVIQDDDRLQYLRGHLQSVQKAIENQLDVRGYCVWSLFDNFEWGLGYSKRFGIIRVDYVTLQRSWKKSAYFYQKVCLSRSIPLKDEE